MRQPLFDLVRWTPRALHIPHSPRETVTNCSSRGALRRTTRARREVAHGESLRDAEGVIVRDARRHPPRLPPPGTHARAPSSLALRQRVATPLADAQGGGTRSSQAIVHHPDKSGDDASSTSAADAFQAIQRAWEVLKVKARPMRPTR